MSGPGSTTVAYAEESGDYLSGPPAEPSYVLPGEDISFDDLSIDNQISAISAPDSTLPKRQLAGNFEGGFGASWTLNSAGPQPWHDLVFPRDSDGSGTRDAYNGDGSFPSSEWYVSVAQPDGTVTERVLQGVVITSVSWEWSPDSPPEVSMTGVYGNERSEAAVTPGTIDRPDGTVDAGSLPRSVRRRRRVIGDLATTERSSPASVRPTAATTEGVRIQRSTTLDDLWRARISDPCEPFVADLPRVPRSS